MSRQVGIGGSGDGPSPADYVKEENFSSARKSLPYGALLSAAVPIAALLIAAGMIICNLTHNGSPM